MRNWPQVYVMILALFFFSPILSADNIPLPKKNKSLKFQFPKDKGTYQASISQSGRSNSAGNTSTGAFPRDLKDHIDQVFSTTQQDRKQVATSFQHILNTLRIQDRSQVNSVDVRAISRLEPKLQKSVALLVSILDHFSPLVNRSEFILSNSYHKKTMNKIHVGLLQALDVSVALLERINKRSFVPSKAYAYLKKNKSAFYGIAQKKPSKQKVTTPPPVRPSSRDRALKILREQQILDTAERAYRLNDAFRYYSGAY